VDYDEVNEPPFVQKRVTQLEESSGNEIEDNVVVDEHHFGDVVEETTEPLTRQDLCRSDEKFRCGSTSTYICEVQKCDGNSDCPNGEDEENCPSNNNTEEEIDDGSGEDEDPIGTNESSSSSSPIDIDPEPPAAGDLLIMLYYLPDFSFVSLLFVNRRNLKD